MKQFFLIVIGGLIAVACGIALALAGRFVVRNIEPRIAHFVMPSFASVADAVVTQPTDGTVISGLKRVVRYSASEEEGLMIAATLSLPTGSIKGVSATAYIVQNLNTGSIAAQANADKILPIASLTKLVTAVVAKKLVRSDEKILISRNVMSTYGNTAGFKIGETIRASDLYYPLLMVSSNDAAEAFAESYGRQRFIIAMNDFVQTIGADNTSFSDASGLSPNNISTANDMITILNWCVSMNQKFWILPK